MGMCLQMSNVFIVKQDLKVRLMGFFLHQCFALSLYLSCILKNEIRIEIFVVYII